MLTLEDGAAVFAANNRLPGVTPLAVVALGLIDRDGNAVLNASDKGISTMTGDGAIPIASGIVMLTKGSAAAVTLAAPTAAQNGTTIRIVSNSLFAHVVTFTGSTLWNGTTGAKITATFPAFKGAGLCVVASGGSWFLASNVATTIA